MKPNQAKFLGEKLGISIKTVKKYAEIAEKALMEQLFLVNKIK